MSIEYPVDKKSRWAVMELASGNIVARDKEWPVDDGSPIEGADPGYVYLKQVAATPPLVDSRLVQLVGTETAFPDENELRTTWTTPARPVEESIMAAKNLEAQALQSLVGDLSREVIETRLVVGAIIKYALKSQVYPTKVATLVNDYEAKAVKVWTNRDVLNAKIADLTAGRTPDLDALWVKA